MGILRKRLSIIVFILCILIAGYLSASSVRAHAEASRDSVRDTSARNSGSPAAIRTRSAETFSASETSATPSIPPFPSPPFNQSPLPAQHIIPPDFASGAASSSHIDETKASLALALARAPIWDMGGIGPFIKCVLLAHLGWPIPTFASECNATSTPPTPPPETAILTILKHSGNFDDFFGFTLGGVSSGTTSITTSGGNGAVNVIVDQGTTTVSEDVRSGWELKGIGCTRNARSAGFMVGSTSWELYLPAGAKAICDFTNSFVGGQGGGGDDGDGGGNDGGTTDSGGGPPNGGGPGGSPPGGGGGNGPIVGSFGVSSGGAPANVLGSSTSTVPTIEGAGGYNPEMPNTGAGGNALAMVLTLLASFVGALASFVRLVRGLRRVH